jgi:hypothetical protein
MTWGADPTDRMTTPQPADQYPVHHYHVRRGENIGLAVVVLLTFILGASAVLAAMFSLADTIDRLMAVPMCLETK